MSSPASSPGTSSAISPGIRAVVFDVGETLIDESRLWLRWAKRLNLPPLTFLGVLGGCAALGRSYADAFEIVQPGIDVDAQEAQWAHDEPSSLRSGFDIGDLYPDVIPALTALRRCGVRLIIAGNQPPAAKLALDAMNLPVDAIVNSAELGVEKPSDAFFDAVAQLAADVLGLKADAVGADAGEAVGADAVGTADAHAHAHAQSAAPARPAGRLDRASIAYIGDRVDNDVLPALRQGMVPILLRRGPWGYLHAADMSRFGLDAQTVTVVDSLLELPGALNLHSKHR